MMAGESIELCLELWLVIGATSGVVTYLYWPTTDEVIQVEYGNLKYSLDVRLPYFHFRNVNSAGVKNKHWRYSKRRASLYSVIRKILVTHINIFRPLVKIIQLGKDILDYRILLRRNNYDKCSIKRSEGLKWSLWTNWKNRKLCAIIVLNVECGT